MRRNNHEEFYKNEAVHYEKSRYETKYGKFFRVLHRSIMDKNIPENSAALDVATGTGQMLEVLSSNCISVIACDLTQAMLDVASERYSSMENIKFCAADAFNLPFENDSFDLVSSSRFLHLFPVESQETLILEMTRVLRPGGRLLVDFYSEDSRRLMYIPVSIYRFLFRKRPENDYRIKISEAKKIMDRAGLDIISINGVGSFLFLLFLWLPRSLLIKAACFIGFKAPKISEQFIVVANKV